MKHLTAEENDRAKAAQQYGSDYHFRDVDYFACQLDAARGTLEAVKALTTKWHLGQPSKDDEWWIQELTRILDAHDIGEGERCNRMTNRGATFTRKPMLKAPRMPWDKGWNP